MHFYRPKNWKHSRYLWDTVILYLAALLIFHLTQKEMGLMQYGIMSRQIIIPIIGIGFTQYINQKRLFSAIWLPALVISLGWIALIPVLQAASNMTLHHWNPRHDILLGLYILLMLMLMQSFCGLIKHHFTSFRHLSHITCTGFAIAAVLCCIIPLSEAIHFSLYHVTVSDSSIFAIQETNYQEALGYLQTYISPAAGIFLFLVLLLIGICSYKAAQAMPPLAGRYTAWFVILLLPVTTFYMFSSLKNKTLFFSTWQTVTAYRHEQQLFAKDYDERYQSLQITTEHTLAKDVPGTVIMVIGESASRDYMTCYTPSLPYDNTPWLESERNNPNFIICNNAYACYNQTVEALIRACTEMSQYNDKKFNESISIVDVARKAGYQTYWLSSQGGMGENDAPITLMMKTADHYAVPDISDRLTYDGDLLPLLKNIDKNQSNFIVIHLKGSHAPYQKDYPENQTQFDASAPEGNYANAILYTDTVLHDIFAYAQQNLNLKAMVYFSDHGENIYHGHGPHIKTFDTLRIPMFIYLSPDYQQYDPQRYDMLQKHCDTYFTNDMIYNTISGIIEAPSNHYESREDFSSPDYDFQRDTLWTFKHTIPISDDTDQ